MTRFLSSIQGKTALIFFGVFVVVLLPANYLIYSRVKQILIEADTKELTAEGEKLFNQVKFDPKVIPLPPLGYSIYVSLNNRVQEDSLFASPDFPIFLGQLLPNRVIEFDTLKIVTLTRSFDYGNGELSFSIARSNNRLIDQISEVRLYLVLANLFSILVAGLLVYVVSGYTLRPIRRIINVAQNVNAEKSIERVPVPQSSDETKQLALTINDMLSRIESSIKNQTNFFASAAHELRTPLAVMKTELTLVQEEKRWHEMLREVERLERIVNDFLMVSQLKTQSLALRKKMVDLNESVVSVMKKVKYLVKEKDSSLQMVLQDQREEHLALVDEDKIETALVNLLENAIKYSPASTVVQIIIENDNGIKIEIRNSISQPIDNPEKFKQEFTKTEALSSGLGMGVWIANEIIQLHGGNLILQSDKFSFSATLQFPG